jgi:hypothetical protein
LRVPREDHVVVLIARPSHVGPKGVRREHDLSVVASIGPGDGVAARRDPEIAGVESRPERVLPPHDRLDHLLVVGIVGLAVVGGFAMVEGHAEMGLGDKPVAADDPNSCARQTDAEEVLPPLRDMGGLLAPPRFQTLRSLLRRQRPSPCKDA